MAIELNVDWLDAPGVKDPLLAKTWARLEMRIDGAAVTRFECARSNAVRSGIFGSLFPLTRWLVENWWHLLYEGPPTTNVFLGARAASTARTRAWFERHSLLFAREGMALPDLSVFSDDDSVWLRWVPDNRRERGTGGPGRFLEEGSARVGHQEVEQELGRFIDAVLERCSDLESEEVADVRANWHEIKRGERDDDERFICATVAALGADRYEPATYEDAVSHKVFERIRGLDRHASRDLVSVSRLANIESNLAVAERLLANLPRRGSPSPHWSSLKRDQQHDLLPHHEGYHRARTVRHHFGLGPDEPIAGLTPLIEQHLGELTVKWVTIAPAQRRGIEGAVAGANGSVPALAASEPTRESSKRFMLARALHHVLFASRGRLRLLTSGSDWEQRASRAFAAELLAPAKALEAELDDGVDDERIAEIAEQFGVSTVVIAHQLENHGIITP